MLLIELEQNNPKQKLKDRNTEAKLSSHENLQQLLTFVVRGAVRWYREGLGEIPSVMKAETEKYMREMDLLGDFLESACSTDDAEAFVPRSDLYEAYLRFTNTKLPLAEFQRQMGRKKFKYGKNTRRGSYRMKTGFWGVRLHETGGHAAPDPPVPMSQALL